jgi:hypothetical protein
MISFLLWFFGRDIPLPLVTSGCDNSGNLRELALNRMKDFGAECRDVRFREVGVSVPPLLFFYGILALPLSSFLVFVFFFCVSSSVSSWYVRI